MHLLAHSFGFFLEHLDKVSIILFVAQLQKSNLLHVRFIFELLLQLDEAVLHAQVVGTGRLELTLLRPQLLLQTA